MKKYLLFSFICALLPLCVNAACNLTKVKTHNDRHFYPSADDYDNKMAYVCGEGYCADGQIIYFYGFEGYTGGSMLSKKKKYSPDLGEGVFFICKHGGDDKWIETTPSEQIKNMKVCNGKEEDDEWNSFVFDDSGDVGVVVLGKDLPGERLVAKPFCYNYIIEKGGVRCNYNNLSKEYVFAEQPVVYKCLFGIWERHIVLDECPNKPTGWHEQKKIGLAVPFYKQNPPFEYTDGVNQACVWCEKGKWDKYEGKCIETESSSAKPSTPAAPGTQPATKKTVEERCREHNGGKKCSPERLECFKKDSATTWKNGKCECTDKSKTWEYKNNRGNCVTKEEEGGCKLEFKNNVVLKNMNTAIWYSDGGTRFCKMPGSDGVDYVAGKPLEDLVKVNNEPVDVELDTETTEGVYFKCDKWDDNYFAFDCKDEYRAGNVVGTDEEDDTDMYDECIKEKIEEKPQQQTVQQQTIKVAQTVPAKKDDNAVAIANAKKVLDDFYTYAKDDDNRSVWKDSEGKFNTMRLASDLTAGVVLGTVGGVVSGVVIKKKQVEKGFDALHCTVGGQAVADWGDEFSVGFYK